jgi:NAD-dependent dihydropyrimidine dehydrogenase PreA subunit
MFPEKHSISAELAMRITRFPSKLFPRILEMMMSEDEMRILLATPGTPKQIAEKVKLSEDDVLEKFRSFYMRGLCYIKEITPEGPVFKLGNIITFHDQVLWDKRYEALGDEFFNAWSAFFNQEALPLAQDMNLGLRILPVEEVIESTRILPYEQASKVIEDARKIVVLECPCRKRERLCDTPLELCITFNALADYIQSRHHGREITKKDALNMLKYAEKRGLVHQTYNNNNVEVICNCCKCCCALLRSIIYYGNKAASAKSRFEARIDENTCDGCKSCLKVCNFNALRYSLKTNCVNVIVENCFGCGLCASMCKKNAIKLVEVRPPEHIPVKTPIKRYTLADIDRRTHSKK